MRSRLSPVRGGASLRLLLRRAGGGALSACSKSVHHAVLVRVDVLAAALVLVLGDWWRHATPGPGILDSCIVALAFWTAVACSATLFIPASLGDVLIAFFLLRRRRLSALDKSDSTLPT